MNFCHWSSLRKTWRDSILILLGLTVCIKYVENAYILRGILATVNLWVSFSTLWLIFFLLGVLTSPINTTWNSNVSEVILLPFSAVLWQSTLCDEAAFRCSPFYDVLEILWRWCFIDRIYDDIERYDVDCVMKISWPSDVAALRC